MEQENLGLLLRLISNYVDHCENIEEAKTFLRVLPDYTVKTYTDEEKEEMYWQTVHALNAGSDEAERGAFLIRLRALISGDDEFIEKIEYLHEVL